MAVDDLFSGSGSTEPVSPIPRLRRWLLVTSGLVVAGPCCCTGPLGALLAIWLWARAGDEMKRAELGLYPEGVGRGARSVRQQAFALMSASSISLCLQTVFFSFYQSAAMWVAQTAMELYLSFSTP
ncbi:hypothetical protein LBMAG42_06920 [Deltaproteobacteria bacterium]|nr:hypothetical protein LBMAG42_06920 [Deltaproteobacteria bacterium]